MGWAAIFGGAGRFVAAAILVLALGLGAAGMMAGALIGVGLAAVHRHLADAGFVAAAAGNV